MSDDKDAIRDLPHLYCFHMDNGEFDALAALFAADGEWVAPYRSVQGSAAIAAWLRQSVPAVPKRMHYTMNTVIVLSGDTATARSNYLAMTEAPGGPDASVRGTYADRFLRTDLGWRFRRRELIHAFKGEMRLTLPR